MTLGVMATWIVVGGVAGWLAQQVVPGTRSGLIGSLFVGICGAVFGGWLIEYTDAVIYLGSELATNIAVAFLGAVVLLFLLRVLS